MSKNIHDDSVSLTKVAQPESNWRVLAEGRIQDEIAKGSPKLVLENFKLQDLSFMGGLQWDALSEIDLHKNYLSSIDLLNQFRNLRIVRANDNYIQEISLNLPRLEELVLHNNYLTKFPLLHSMPRIRLINLNSNKISDFRVDFKHPSCLSLQSLDIGSNEIDFTAQDFYDFLEKMKKLKNLKYLVILNNPFADEKKFDQIVSQIPSLETFNFEKAEEYRKQVQEEEKKGKEPTKGMDKKKKGKQKTKIDKTNFYFPTLEILCYNLEAANSHPAYALEHLKELAMDVDRIQEHLEMIDEYFGKGKDEVEINEMIETFMQNSQLLIDNHFELQSIMLTILSKLSIIKFYEFGVRCFNTLKDLMIAGKEMEERVIEVLKKEVINKLQQQNPELIPASLLKGLQELVKLTEKAEMLTGLYENCFPTWLRILLERVNACKRIATIYENNDHFDSIIALMSVSVKNCRTNSSKAVSKDLISLVADIVNESTWEQARYIDCLSIVEHISMFASEAANKFIDKFVHTNIMKNIRYSMHIYKKNNELKEEDSKDTEEKLKIKYLTLAAEIDCLGGLLEADKQKREPIIRDPLIEEMLQIASHYKTDPVLLTSICKFARQLFSREEMKNNQHQLEPKIKKMQNLVQLIPYLGLKKYDEVLRMARRYYDPTSFADKEKATQLQHLDDVVVQQLFISIINLINFFCEEAANVGSCPIFEEVSQSLNDANRETALFNCLEVPNDDVKLAVVECLNNVPLSEFDTEEIATIIRLIGSYKNIGAGKTEYVLAKIFQILIKLTKDKESDSGKNFRIKFGEKSITEALEILIRNQMRYLDDEEEEQEKLALSLSIVHFLKYTSINPDLKRYMLNRHEQFKQAMFADEQCTRYQMMKFPIEIEETWIGRNMDVLIFAVTGADSIEPYNYVSFRLLQRMADILMNKIDVDAEDPFESGVDVIETLKVHYRRKFKERKHQERSYWEDPPAQFISNLQDFPDAFNAFFQQHYLFTSNNGIPLIRMFLTKKVSAFEQYLKKEYDEVFEKQQLSLRQTLQVMKEKVEFKEIEKQKKDDEKKIKTAVQKAADSDGEEDGINILRMALQQEELGSNYDPDKAQDHFIQTATSKSKNVEAIKKREIKMGVQNVKMRSLCIAAYLRCLFAAIEYAPKEELKQEAIRHLKDEYVFRSLTQLCDTTGWFEANIGAKYLRVMRHVIKVPLNEGNESQENLPHYEIISVVIRKILNQVIIKIKNEQQKPLTQEDKILIYELANTCQIICTQCSLFKWSSMEVKQQGQHTRTRRTPQEKIIDRQISLLFPSQSILTFIAILFRDMDLSHKIFENSSGSQDLVQSAFIHAKDDAAREHIKMFLGDYLSKCKDNKYDVLEAFMKGVVFEKKKMRESYLQEILKALQDASYRTAIEQFIIEKKLCLEGEYKERIINIQWVDMSIDGAGAFKPRLLVMTNKGIHIFRASGSKPCSVCPPENLCPEGPREEYKFKYDKIQELISFPHMPQKLLIIFQLNNGIMKKSQSISVSLIIPTHSGAISLIAQIKEIMQDLSINEDFLMLGSIMLNFEAEDELRVAQYVSFNPTTGFFGSWGEEPIIQSCMLLAISNNEIVLLKENWAKWFFVDDQSKITSVVERIQQKREKEILDGISQAQKQAEIKLKAGLQGVLQPIFRKSIDEISNLHVHKGKDPVVELQFGSKIEKIIFQCDFNRQKFIEAILDAKNSNNKSVLFPATTGMTEKQ